MHAQYCADVMTIIIMGIFSQEKIIVTTSSEKTYSGECKVEHLCVA